MGGKFVGMSIGIFRFGKSTGLLMSPALIEPGLDRELLSRFP